MEKVNPEGDDHKFWFSPQNLEQKKTNGCEDWCVENTNPFRFQIHEILDRMTNGMHTHSFDREKYW